MFAQKKKNLISGKTFAVVVIILFVAGYFINTTDFGEKDEQNLSATGANQEAEPTNAVQPNAAADSEAQPGTIHSDTQLLMRINDQVTNTTKTQELLMPPDVVGKTLKEAESILLSRYEDSMVRTLNESYVLLYKVIEKTGEDSTKTTGAQMLPEENEQSPSGQEASFYMIKADNEIIKVYRGDEEGNLELMRETQINIDFLSSVDQELFRYGVIKHNMDEVNELLQDFES